MKKVRYIPPGYVLSYIHEAAEFVVYQQEKEGRLYGIAFSGKSANPAWHYKFKSQESLSKLIEETVAGLEAHKAAVKARRAQRFAPHGLKGGEVFSSSWGWEQTNVEYYQVVSVKGQMVELREIAQERNEQSFMSGECAPLLGVFIGEPIKRRVSMTGNVPKVKIHQSATAYLEKPVQVIAGAPVYGKQYWSSYA